MYGTKPSENKAFGAAIGDVRTVDSPRLGWAGCESGASVICSWDHTASRVETGEKDRPEGYSVFARTTHCSVFRTINIQCVCNCDWSANRIWTKISNQIISKPNWAGVPPGSKWEFDRTNADGRLEVWDNIIRNSHAQRTVSAFAPVAKCSYPLTPAASIKTIIGCLQGPPSCAPPLPPAP